MPAVMRASAIIEQAGVPAVAVGSAHFEVLGHAIADRDGGPVRPHRQLSGCPAVGYRRRVLPQGHRGRCSGCRRRAHPRTGPRPVKSPGRPRHRGETARTGIPRNRFPWLARRDPRLLSGPLLDRRAAHRPPTPGPGSMLSSGRPTATQMSRSASCCRPGRRPPCAAWRSTA